MSAVIHSGRLQQRLKKNQDDSEDEDSQEGDFFAERPAAPSSHHAPPRWPEGATRKMTSWTPLLTIARKSGGGSEQPPEGLLAALDSFRKACDALPPQGVASLDGRAVVVARLLQWNDAWAREWQATRRSPGRSGSVDGRKDVVERFLTASLDALRILLRCRDASTMPVFEPPSVRQLLAAGQVRPHFCCCKVPEAGLVFFHLGESE